LIPKFDKIHNHFKLNGHHFNHKDLKEVAYSLIKEGEPFEKIIGDFLTDWLNTKDYLLVNTSGSTGIPKPIKVYKQAMVNSAIATGDFFNLKPTNTALHCLPTNYIAGKMMLVRAMILGLNIDCVTPSAQPVFDTQKSYNFCAMTPMQLQHVIKYTANIKTIIVGGAKVTMLLKKELQKSTSSIYETYGMTETLTHIALKSLQTQSRKGTENFKTLPHIDIEQDERHCLVIKAPKLLDTPIITNDIVNLVSDTEFKWLGRYDNVINSGGVKLYPEEIETKLQNIINERFIITGVEDATLGEKVVLIIENPKNAIKIIEQQIIELNSLTKFEIPKNIYSIPKFLETPNGKIKRKVSLNLVVS